MSISKQEMVHLIGSIIAKLKIDKVCIFIGGSFFFAKDDNIDCFLNGSSDIDIIAVCPVGFEKSLKHLFADRQEVFSLFMSEKCSVLNYKYRYGKGRNVLHIKFMKQDLFQDIVALRPVSFTSFRAESLGKIKPTTSFSSNTSTGYSFTYTEEPAYGGYLLRYKFNPIQRTIFFLSDIHSMILLSICVQDFKNIKQQRNELFFLVKKILQQSKSEVEILSTFQYFKRKGILTREWEKILIECFLKKDNLDIYFQDVNEKRGVGITAPL